MSINTLHKGDDDDDNNNNNNNKWRPYSINRANVEFRNKSDTIKIGANGTISKSLRQYVSYIPGKHEVKKMRTTAIFDTAHKLRKVLM